MCSRIASGCSSSRMVLTGCYPLKPVGNILKDSLQVRRECPGCTCGVDSSLAMKRAVSSAFFHHARLTQGKNGNNKTFPTGVAEMTIRRTPSPASFRHNPWFRFPSSSLFEFLSSAKKYAGYSNTNEKDTRPSLARHALPEKEFSTQCARHVVQSCNRYYETHVFQRQHP